MNDFHYITVATTEHPILSLLQKTVTDKHESITVLGRELNKTFAWSATGNFVFKLTYFWNYVNNPIISEDAIVLFTDAFDVLYSGTKEKIIQRFLQFDKPIVFGAESNCWPDESVKHLYPKKDEQFPYLNSGLFIGRVSAFRELYTLFINAALETDDQRFWTRCFLTRPDLIELDYNNTLFLNYYKLSKDSITMDSRDNTIYYGTSNPLFIHFNGDKKDLTDHFLRIFTSDKRVENSKYKFKNGSQYFVQDTLLPPIKNIRFPLVAYCVSYNYIDTLRFMLPVNFLHFDQIYIVTQENDLPTIEFCKQFENVKVLFYNFQTGGKTFDKYGALKYVQQIIYREYPDHWYLGIDSDILLPTNFIDILLHENLNVECIYGAVRNNVLKTSELRDKNNVIQEHKNWFYNQPTDVIGCFQLHKLKCLYSTNYIDASQGDTDFVDINFNIRCNLQNLLFIHMGATGKNWKGKIVEFIHDDKSITVNDLFYSCNVACINKYYNRNKEQIHMPIASGDNGDVDDVWTCSKRMRDDIADFFKHHSQYKIAEIGAHKGYLTRYLADVFQKVYAVDNNEAWTSFNKNYNQTIANIEYIKLDIYKNDWNTALPCDIDVSFINAGHSYDLCKSDLVNSIKQFKSLKYVIFDDYGVWEGVKQVVDEAIESGQLIFERFIGINNVPGPQGIVKYVHEGVICSINENYIPQMKQVQIQPRALTSQRHTSPPHNNFKYKNMSRMLLQQNSIKIPSIQKPINRKGFLNL